MSFIKWHPVLYSINNTEFDNHHQKLVDIINKFHKAMMEGKGVDSLEQIFFELKNYTNFHFKAEEEKMLAINYPFYESHKKEHDKLIARMEELSVRAKTGEKLVSIDTFKFLKDWLFTHISRVDKQMGEYIINNKT
ncbi:MAG: hemerythrin family protein [Bacteroidetes bacterium]|nr:hemerythrin family protein [Bacteroidota bacterium]